MDLPQDLRDSLRQREARLSINARTRPSMLIQQPLYYRDETTTRNGHDNLYGNADTSSYDDSYSGSDLDEEDEGDSFAGDADGHDTESDDGIIPPQEASKREKEKQNKIGAKEHQRVFRARIFVLFLLMATALANALMIYFLSRNKEYENYYNQFDVLAKQIMEGTQENVRLAFQALESLSIAITTWVEDDPEHSFPMVTFPNFASLAPEVRNVTGGLQIIFVPLVDQEDRSAWEQYSRDNQQWVRQEAPLKYSDRYRRWLSPASNRSSSSSSEILQQQFQSLDNSLRYPIQQKQQQQQQQQQQPKQYRSPEDYLEQPYWSSSRHSQAAARQRPNEQARKRLQEFTEHDLRGVIPGRIHPAPTREEQLIPELRFAPVWQMSPVPYYRGIVLHDMYRERSFHSLSHQVHSTQQAVVSSSLDDPIIELFVEDDTARGEFYDSPNKDNHDTVTHDNTLGTNKPAYNSLKYPPTSVMVQPVFDSLDPVTAIMVGYLIALIPWESYLIDTFRADTEAAALARYACDAAAISDDEAKDEALWLNYKVQGGGNVTYLGPGALSGQDEFDFTVEKVMPFPVVPPPRAATEIAQLLPLNWTDPAAESQSHAPILSPCDIQLLLFPTEELRNMYITNYPVYYALSVVAVFVLLTLVFFTYNWFVERRRGRAMAVAEKTNRIVTNLFPSHFADQLISEGKKKDKAEKKNKKKKRVVIEEAPTRQLKKYMNDKKKKGRKGSYVEVVPDGGETPLFLAESKPIADLFPDTTVLFADIAGFTAWSSVREPSQVFTLLETVYQNFDFLAKQYGIFKIETIGDCYVAVCGLPEPRADHAVAMSRFALACMQKMKVLVSELEVTLGPDTGDLTIRTGLHSGPVTAGVLRGERARFQLFGDTVNTAARMESTGMRDKIHISQETADLLIAAGKIQWFTKREGLVQAKGKGELQTYWLQSSTVNRRVSMGHGTENRRRHSMGGASRNPSARDSSGNASRGALPKIDLAISVVASDRNVARLAGEGSDSFDSSGMHIPNLPVHLTKKQSRLVKWNCEMIQSLIRQIVARRNILKNASKPLHLPFTAMMSDLPKFGVQKQNQQQQSTMPLDEVVEVINLPEFDVAAYHGSTDAKHVRLDPVVVTQLRRFISLLATKYRDNPFHNFDHASHVAMSVSKLLSRIVAPDLESIADRHDNPDISSSLHLTRDMKDLHDHTYGITSDPLTQLAVVLSALIHDVDHRGIPNNILIQEEPEMAAKYNNKSVAEQNSVDVAWEIFMDDSLKDLRETICPEFAEQKRLRQIIVSSVLATDIFDPELSALRKNRWNKAFQTPKEGDVTPFERRRPSFNVVAAMNRNAQHEINRKATIVIEHLIQASDVAHTMQHWHIYQKWNECLFQEMYLSYKQGRSQTDPSEGWYKGEIWFFDNYVIPLAKKLKECGVFGVSSDEYLDYANANRNEWESKGQSIVAGMIEKYGEVVERVALGYE